MQGSLREDLQHQLPPGPGQRDGGALLHAGRKEVLGTGEMHFNLRFYVHFRVAFSLSIAISNHMLLFRRLEKARFVIGRKMNRIINRN